ncbi:hypothetical Protein YC6258_05314 [Gynuella sunshinyii YC6258]|uniref:Uncharacterized protein n=1 Tax=Gynuella sunshinyii YC6258 TaxID=1445510 RepID=A0A0C5W3Z8_9GAMM|nr:hypothetical Protein YC6258_05314 [Gynuella sunshinyii YC6258]
MQFLPPVNELVIRQLLRLTEDVSGWAGLLPLIVAVGLGFKAV